VSSTSLGPRAKWSSTSKVSFATSKAAHPLAAVVRLDRDVAALSRELTNLHQRLLDIAEAALDRLAASH
jgi:ABC-type branched-subunit amino acid transport system ATPase component